MSGKNRFFELNTGAKIPSIGLGTWNADHALISDSITAAVKVKIFTGNSKDDTTVNAFLLLKLQIGYRHIDCARRYGNEKEIGFVLKKLFDEGVVKREELWITSKLWNTDHAPEDVAEALDSTLKDLQLDYIDLYLIHYPVSMKKGSIGFSPENLSTPDIPSTWKTMEELYDSGKARAIGVSNFSTKKLGDLLKIARVPPAVNQVECHPLWQQPKLHEFCKSHGVHLSGYSSLGAQGEKRARTEMIMYPILRKIAERLGKSPAQIALRWGLQMGHSVLPKSSNVGRLEENFDIFDWSVPEVVVVELSEIPQERLDRGDFFVHEKLGYFKTVEELWDGEL